MFSRPQFMRVAVVGASKAEIEPFLTQLKARHMPISSLRLFLPESSVGEKVLFGGEEITAEPMTEAGRADVDLAFLSGSQPAADQRPKFLKAGAGVIDISAIT